MSFRFAGFVSRPAGQSSSRFVHNSAHTDNSENSTQNSQPNSNPFKNAFSRGSRGNEAHFFCGKSEAPYVGCYFFDGLLTVAASKDKLWRKRYEPGPVSRIESRVGVLSR